MTIYDISEKAGVSIATVSRVLNGSSSVSDSTRQKVLDVIEQCGYTPNAFARGLGLNTMKTTYDGFAIAEQDLAQRGPGDFFAKSAGGAIRQSGGVEFRLASQCGDGDLLTRAFSAADEVIANDLTGEHPALADAVGRMFANTDRHDIMN